MGDWTSQDRNPEPQLGVEDNIAQSLYATIAPNPASDKTIVNFFNPAQGQVQFDLYSLQGQLVQRAADDFSEGSQGFELSLEGLTKGFYLLQIKHKDGVCQTLKLIID